MIKSLGNTVPTDTERDRMVAVMNELKARIDPHGSFAPARFNETDNTVELCWAAEGRPYGKAWATAWIDGLGRGRTFMLWRHPSYRYGRDDAWIYENTKVAA